MAHLEDNITALKGIGPAKAKLFSALGIHTVRDLLYHFPRDYEDRTKLVSIGELEADQPACFRAVVNQAPLTHHVRKGMDITKAQVSDHTARLNLTFFNQSYAASALHYGEEYIFYGRLSGDYLGYQMVNPVFEALDKPGVLTRRILPIYPLTAGLTSAAVGKAVRTALACCGEELPELLPECIRRDYGLMGGLTAYQEIHDPTDWDRLAQARRRLVFEEFFLFSAGLSLLRARREENRTAPYGKLDLEPFLARLPFRLTGAQSRAIAEICGDLRKGVPMNRLVQGDVGSGKTMVAAAALYLAVQNGHQAALMTPTEILAEQHFAALETLFRSLGISCALLTGSLSPKAKAAARQALAEGTVQIAIGTQALLTEATVFRDLGLVVTDEQHRFGVAQRGALSEKGRDCHVLVMSATPIPRTLTLILYGDLEVSVLDELPPGREPIDTFLVGESYRVRLNGFIRRQVSEGHQCYIVCPAVEESETESVKSAEVWAETLQQAVFPDLRVGLLHGQMKGARKEAVMAAFSRGDLDILVATTVIEVGVDVPNATLMVIEDADRFGLSQLHQLRGRVGRGKAKSWCILVSDTQNPDTKARLKALCATNDGFQIADEDLKLRGPGDLLGSRQHGLPAFRVASLSLDLDTLKQAQEASKVWLEAGAPGGEALYARIRELFSRGAAALN